MSRYKTHPCTKCGNGHTAMADVCHKCRRAEKVAEFRGRFGRCVICGKEKQFDALMVSHYCITCSGKAFLISRKAHGKVAGAVLRGDLPRLDGSIPCVDCGTPAAQYEHRDYTKPTDVEPVCRACNQKRGPADVFITQKRMAA